MAYSIQKAAALLGLHPKTLRRWEDQKKFIPLRTLGNQRRFSDKDIAALRAIKEGRAEPVIYDRILTLDEAAKKLNVSPDTIRRWTKQGKIAQTVNDQLEPGYSEKALDKLITPQAKPTSPTLPPKAIPLRQDFVGLPHKWQKPFVYATLATILATAGILAYMLILKPPFLADPSVEQLDLTQDIEVALPRTASFLDGHITIGTDTGDYSFLDQNANLYVKNQALIEGSVNTGSLQLLPSEQPESQIGRLYVSQDSGDLLYFDGLEWLALNATASGQNQPSLSGVYDGEDLNITLGNNATASATSLKLTLAGTVSAFQILGGAGQELATFDDDALYPITFSQPTQVLANLYARQFIDADNINYYLDPANSSVSLAVAGDATISGTLTFSKNGEYLTNATNDYLIASGGITVGGTTSFGISSSGHGNFKKGNFEETLTAGALFDANGQVDLGDGGDTLTLNGSTLTLTGTTLDINAATWDLSSQAVAVTLIGAVNALNFDSNTLSLDTTGNKIGIGTATPVGKLDVSGAVTGKALAIFNETGDQDIIVASSSGVTRFRVGNNGTVTIGDGSGKLDVGTTDPPYTINGDKYATYLAGMIGIKEETTGVITTNEYIAGVGYRHTIDFASLPEASDLWLFAKVTDLKKHLAQMVVLLSPAGSTRTWYTLDTAKHRLNIYSSRPTTVSYRLTAPRFDADAWANTRDSDSTGFIINDEGQWQENLAGTIIGNSDSPLFELWDEFIAYLSNLPTLRVKEKIISPVVETQNLATNFISPLVVEEPIVIDTDVSVSGTLTANQIESSTITNLRDKIADLAEFYREQTATAAATPSDPVSDDLAIQLLAPTSDASDSAYLTVENLEAKAGFFSEYLAVIGQATLTDVKINNLLTVNSITSANGAINFLAGLMTLDSTGKIYINGDVNIAGNLTVADTIIASQIAPPQDTDLSIKIASESALSIYNLIDEEAVASIDASGSGSFSSLNLKASGTATISAGLNSVAVSTEQLNQNSQVIVTFTRNYAPATKYWVTKEPELKLFNVFVNYPVNEETTLDWLLIN